MPGLSKPTETPGALRLRERFLRAQIINRYAMRLRPGLVGSTARLSTSCSPREGTRPTTEGTRPTSEGTRPTSKGTRPTIIPRESARFVGPVPAPGAFFDGLLKGCSKIGSYLSTEPKMNRGATKFPIPRSFPARAAAAEPSNWSAQSLVPVYCGNNTRVNGS